MVVAFIVLFCNTSWGVNYHHSLTKDNSAKTVIRKKNTENGKKEKGNEHHEE